MAGPFDILSGYLEGKGPDSLNGMDPAYADNLSRFLEENPYGVSIISGVRSNERQAQLWQQALQKYGSPDIARKWVAPPGRSMHNHGKAVDLSYEDPQAKAWALQNAPAYGLAFPMSNEPWHVEPAGARGGSPAPMIGGGKTMTLPAEAKGNPMADAPSPNAAEMIGPPPTNPGGLGGLGGANFGNMLQAVGLALLSAKDRRRPLEMLAPLLAHQQDQAMKALQYQQEQEWRRKTFETGRQDHADTLKQQDRQFGIQNQQLDLSREDKKTDNARQAEQLEIQKYGPLGTKMRALYPDLKPGQPEYLEKYKELMAQERESTGGNYGLTPIWGTDKDGNPVIIQLGKDGKPTQPQLPEGVRIGKDAIKIDAGTHTVLIDPVTRQQIGIVPKNNMEAARETGIGTAAAGASAKLGGALDNAQMGLDAIDKLMTHKGLDGNLGWSGKLPNAPGSDATDAATYMEQLNGQSFLGAYNDLRGAGAITEQEGKAATNARTRMARAQNAQQYREALQEYRQVILNGMERAKQMAAGKVSAEPLPSGIKVQGSGQRTKSGVSWSVEGN